VRGHDVAPGPVNLVRNANTGGRLGHCVPVAPCYRLENWRKT
jgi:hypothetical protein